MGGLKDHELMAKVRAAEFTFVTNNAVDFRRLFQYEPIHPGLVILIPNAMPSIQRALIFRRIGFYWRPRPRESSHRSQSEGRDIRDKRVRVSTTDRSGQRRKSEHPGPCSGQVSLASRPGACLSLSSPAHGALPPAKNPASPLS